MKLFLDRRQVFIDIGVIELEVVEDERLRAVVNELGTLVEERRVVLIGFDDEELPATQPGTDRKVSRNSADEETGIEPCMLENPAEHAGGGGLAVRASDSEHVNVSQYFARQPFRSRGVGNAAVEQCLDDRDTARHHVAYDHHVGAGHELPGFETRGELDTQRLQLRAHGWIDILVRPGDAMARSFRDGRDAAHERTADAENVNVHDANCASKPIPRELRTRLRTPAPMRSSIRR